MISANKQTAKNPIMPLMAVWVRHRAECRPIGDIVRDAREGRLPGARISENGISLEIEDEAAALAAMRKGAA